ncbi:MAG: hypothetical protein V4679_01350 [Pseudomonadota bacterium]
MKQTAREKRLARQAPLPLTPESIGLDATLYASALHYLFDRPVPGKKEREWYWDMDEPEFEATPLQWTLIQTALFANAGSDLAPYSDEQVGMGLNCVMSTNAGDIPLQALDPSVPLADALRMLQAFPRLWIDCIGPRRSHVHETIGSSSGRLGFVCYMWFDVWPTFWNARHIPEWRDAMWQVFCQMLDVPCRDVQVSALHGIGHEGRALLRPRELQERVKQFIRSVPAHDEELRNYAGAAAQGMVQ